MKSAMTDIEFMIDELCTLNGVSYKMPRDIGEQKALLDKLMTISVPGQLSKMYYEAEEKYLSKKMTDKRITSVDEMDNKLLDDIYIFKGDITSIKADAIVNAANEKLLGCFIPGHRCIDNAIHTSAGLGLRNECYQLMMEQGHDEPVGEAKVTLGYHLPSKYVVHTVGPNLNVLNPASMDEVIKQLQACYTSILKEVSNYEDIRNIVFCSISTGVYGVPIDIASKAALETIGNYLKEREHHLDRVIINVFSQEDYIVYKESAEQIRQTL